MSSSVDLKQSIVGSRCRHLHVVLGDQLSGRLKAFNDFDAEQDAVLMAEVDGEQIGPSHKVRTAVFLSAMRHFALEQIDKGRRVRYVKASDSRNSHSLAGELEQAIEVLTPERIVLTHPGDWRVLDDLTEAAGDTPLDIVDDDHFLVTPDEFSDWASGKKQLVMEYFYRQQRKKLGILMEGPADKQRPVGGEWNYDKDNRKSFKDPPRPTPPPTHEPDDVTREVIDLVHGRWSELPGNLDADTFRWPVTRRSALASLNAFIADRLSRFGPYEDAMWTGEPFLYHSVLSVPMNLHLIDPMECVERALEAYDNGDAPLNSVEGFVRQLIGWREYIRGIYWHEGRDYRDRNSLDQHGSLPDFYWTGDTDMRCMAECLSPVLDHAWSHHIPRLMVLSSFAMMAGVHPREIGDWFFGMYADSVDWATTPNTIGMGMHCDGDSASSSKNRHGVVGTKPYAGSGKYIGKMSNFCENCRYDNSKRTGEDACPFNTLYWDFLIRHEQRFKKNNRMAMMLKHVERMDKEQRVEITSGGKAIRKRLGIAPISS